MLQWPDIDFDQSTITVQPKDGWHNKNYKPRTVFTMPTLYEALQEHQRQQAEYRFKSEYVFTYQGKPIKWGVDIGFKTIVGKAGLEGVTLHTLRHTFASQLALAGVPLRDIQELMGHQSFETTLRYSHLSEDHAKKQVLRLPFASD